mgnify:CR=1 FL=1
MLRPTILLAQSNSSGDGTPMLADAGRNPVAVFDEVIRGRIDLLNHPAEIEQLITNIHYVWAAIFGVVGLMCVLQGYRWHKILVIVLAALGGVWAGVAFGEHVGSPEIAAACCAGLFAILSWPLLRYSVAVFGGLAGAFAGANIWTAIGQDPSQHHIGALVGLVVAGMLAFMAFRTVVIMLTVVGGATLLVLGAMAGLMQIEAWQRPIIDFITNTPLVMPVIVGSVALIGAVYQFSGGTKGMCEMANKADTSKAKPKPA